MYSTKAVEINLFSNLAKDWWDPEGSMRLLHTYNAIRVPYVSNGLVQGSTEHGELDPLIGKHILDVGCGGGVLSEAIARLGAKVTGIDISKELIDVAKAHADEILTNNKPIYYHSSIEEHAKRFENHYDAIVASEVIEHVDNPQLFVQSCVHALKPGGKIFFTTPNRSRMSQFILIFLFENIFKCIPTGAHQYEKFITPQELAVMLQQNNCCVEPACGIIYNPINQKWSFSNYQFLIYAIQAQKMT